MAALKTIKARITPKPNPNFLPRVILIMLSPRSLRIATVVLARTITPLLPHPDSPRRFQIENARLRSVGHSLVRLRCPHHRAGPRSAQVRTSQNGRDIEQFRNSVTDHNGIENRRSGGWRLHFRPVFDNVQNPFHYQPEGPAIVMQHQYLDRL